MGSPTHTPTVLFPTLGPAKRLLMPGRSARRKAAQKARSAGADAAPRAPAMEVPRVSDKTHDEVVASAYQEALCTPGMARSLTAAALAKPLEPANEAQRALLARALASDARFKLMHDATRAAEVLICSVDPETLHRGISLSSMCQPAIFDFYNSAAWRAAADSRSDAAAAPPRAASLGECTFCRGAAARVLLTHDDGVCCFLCTTPTMRAYMRRDTDAPVPLCCANCPRAPWTFEPYDEEEEEEEDEQGRLVLFGEVTERSYAACDCGLEREAEDVTVRRMPTCASCDATLHDEALRKRCGACRRVYYCGRDCQKAHWRTHKADCARS